MILSEAAFGLCLLFLICTFAAQTVADSTADRQALHRVRLGLSLSACAYLFHMLGKSTDSSYSVLSLLCRLGGITFLWLAWKDHWTRQREMLADKSREPVESDESLPLQTALPPAYVALYSGLNSRAREALYAAQEEALRQRRCCVDTDLLLLGLLRVPHSAAAQMLAHAQITAEAVAQELARQTGPAQSRTAEPSSAKEMPPGEPALSHRARQVLLMAEMEAHRFGKTFVGTEHLLLGLLLIGTGPAAAVLFEAGLTIDGLRRQVIAAKRG